MNYIKKAFYKPAWVIACRMIKKDQTIIPNRNQKPFDVLLPKEHEWYADPFCFCESEQAYVFMEVMGRNGSKGTIGVCEYKESSFGEVKDALFEPFHLSFPNVFKYDNHYYMIPETGEARQIRLYESLDFPYNWQLKKILVENVQVVDSSFVVIDRSHYLVFSHDIENNKNCLRLFQFDLSNLEMTEVEKPPEVAEDRPGGNAIYVNGEQFRILQDCKEFYGKQLLVYKIDECGLEKDCYRERYIDSITIDMIPFKKQKKYTRIHTLTRSGKYEAIDTLYERFYITKPFNKVMSSFKKR